jgi:hypothetical protein
MDIIINVSEPRRTNSSNISFEESENIVGNIEITFGNGEVYRRRECNIPLFLAEIKLFIDGVEKRGLDTWTFMFAPFLHGRMRSDEMIITRPLRGEHEDVVDVLDQASINILRNKIIGFQKEYGRLDPSGEEMS